MNSFLDDIINGADVDSVLDAIIKEDTMSTNIATREMGWGPPASTSDPGMLTIRVLKKKKKKGEDNGDNK